MARRTARPTLLVDRSRSRASVDVAAREAFIAHQRHPARRRRRLRRTLRVAGLALTTVLAVAALGVTAVAAAHAVRSTPLLGIRRVEVLGGRRVSEPAVLAAARIEPGLNLLALDVDGVVDRVEALPGVRRARVLRHLPDRVVVAIEEREPFALVNVGGPRSGLYWVDADGYLVGPERRPGAPSSPVVSGVELPSEAADHPVGDRLHTGLALLRAVQRAGGRVVRRISEIDVGGAGGPALYTVNGIHVAIGAEAWDERLARLDGVLGEIEEQGEAVESVDLRFRDLVVWRPRGVTSAAASGSNAGNLTQR
jgi:cell division protein FtsQ